MGKTYEELNGQMADSSAATTPHTWRPFRLTWLIWNIFLAIGLIMYFLVPKFTDVYKQVKVAMPTSTVCVTHISDFICFYPWAWLLGTFAISLWIGRMVKSYRAGRIAEWVAGAAFLVVMGLIAWGLFQPLLSITYGLD